VYSKEIKAMRGCWNHEDTGVEQKQSKRSDNWKIEPATVSDTAARAATPVKIAKMRRQDVENSDRAAPFDSNFHGRQILWKGTLR
jgi:hypothetical protein